MTRIRSVARWLSLLSCSVVVCQAVAADQTVRNPHVKRTLDVSLHPQGLLIGQLVNPQGKPKANASIRLYAKGGEIIRTRTDAQGRFAIQGLKGGSYQLATAHLAVPVRAWPQTSAPPHVAVGALLVEGTVVRGQPEPMPTPTPEGVSGEPIPVENVVGGSYSGGYASASSAGSSGLFGYGILGNGGILGASPLVVGAGVAAAIAIPIAIEANDDDEEIGGSSGSGEPAS